MLSRGQPAAVAGTLIQHGCQSPPGTGIIPEAVLPDPGVLHAEIGQGVGGVVSEPLGHGAVEADAQRLEIAHLAVQAGNELTVDDIGMGEALFDDRFQCGHEPEGAHADPDDVLRPDDGEQLLQHRLVFRLAAGVDHHGVEMEGQGVSPCLASGGGPQARFQRGGSPLLGCDDARGVEGPGEDRFSAVVQPLEPIDVGGFGFQFQNRSRLGGKAVDQPGGEIGPLFPDQAVGEFAGADAAQLRCLQMPVQLRHQVVVIDKELEDGRMKIALEDAVGAIHGAIGADVQNLIAAADILPGAGALLEKSAFVAGQQEGLFGRGPGIVSVL